MNLRHVVSSWRSNAVFYQENVRHVLHSRRWRANSVFWNVYDSKHFSWTDTDVIRKYVEWEQAGGMLAEMGRGKAGRPDKNYVDHPRNLSPYQQAQVDAQISERLAQFWNGAHVRSFLGAEKMFDMSNIPEEKNIRHVLSSWRVENLPAKCQKFPLRRTGGRYNCGKRDG